MGAGDLEAPAEGALVKRMVGHAEAGQQARHEVGALEIGGLDEAARDQGAQLAFGLLAIQALGAGIFERAANPHPRQADGRQIAAAAFAVHHHGREVRRKALGPQPPRRGIRSRPGPGKLARAKTRAVAPGRRARQALDPQVEAALPGGEAGTEGVTGQVARDVELQQHGEGIDEGRRAVDAGTQAEALFQRVAEEDAGEHPALLEQGPQGPRRPRGAGQAAIRRAAAPPRQFQSAQHQIAGGELAAQGLASPLLGPPQGRIRRASGEGEGRRLEGEAGERGRRPRPEASGEEIRAGGDREAAQGRDAGQAEDRARRAHREECGGVGGLFGEMTEEEFGAGTGGAAAEDRVEGCLRAKPQGLNGFRPCGGMPRDGRIQFYRQLQIPHRLPPRRAAQQALEEQGRIALPAQGPQFLPSRPPRQGEGARQDLGGRKIRGPAALRAVPCAGGGSLGK